MDYIQDYILDYIKNKFFKLTNTPIQIITYINIIIEFDLLTIIKMFLLKYNINILIYFIFCF
jgi:hypothetical protein